MENQIPVSGGCLCGAIRYESIAAPLRGTYCHCAMCQKGYGGLFQMAVKFAGSAFRYTKGMPKFYRSSPYGKRGFCPHCGSPITFNYEGNHDSWILFGSLDRPGDWPMTKDATWGPIVHFCVESKVAWYEIADGLPQMTVEDIPVRAPAIEHAGDAGRSN
jgi:hypothetical protein